MGDIGGRAGSAKQCEHRSTRVIQHTKDGKVASEWVTCNTCVVMRTRIRRLAARMYCGVCRKWTEIADGLRCSECGL